MTTNSISNSKVCLTGLLAGLNSAIGAKIITKVMVLGSLYTSGIGCQTNFNMQNDNLGDYLSLYILSLLILYTHQFSGCFVSSFPFTCSF